MQKILIVDDEQDILDMLQYNLKKEGYEVLRAHNGRQALGLASLQPDLIILDVMMPEYDGFEVCRRLRSQDFTSKIPILMLTAKGGEVDEVLGLEFGADDYIQKPISVRILLARIKALLRRKPISTPDERTQQFRIDEIELIIDKSTYTATLGNKELLLPRKEFEVLLYLVMHRGKVYSRQSLLNEIWGHNVFVVDRTVDVHIRKIREKLGSHADYIETIKGVGYRFRAG